MTTTEVFEDEGNNNNNNDNGRKTRIIGTDKVVEEDEGEFRNREKDEEEEEEGERSFIGTFLRRRSAATLLEASAGASAVLGFDTTGMKELRAEKTAARGRWFL